MASETATAIILLIIVAMMVGIIELPDVPRPKNGRPLSPYLEHKRHELECRSCEIGIIRDDAEIFGRNQITVFEKTLLGAHHHRVLLWRTAKVGLGALSRRVRIQGKSLREFLITITNALCKSRRMWAELPS